MDLKQLEYIVKIAEENNITRAAEKLYITQSALNQQLLKLEKELGAPLFHRSRTDWHLTAAGELYVKNAREMLMLKQDTYNQIHDMANIRKGRLSVGFTPSRGIHMFSAIYPDFHRTHAGILVEPRELSVHDQHIQLAAGELDIGFLTLLQKHRKPALTYLPIKSEEIFLAVPRIHPISALAGRNTAPFPQVDLKLLKEEPFVLMYKTSTIRELVDGLFREAGFTPHILFETSSTSTIVTMIRAKLCCGLIPAHYVDKDCDDICYFSLPSKPSWEITAAYKKKRYISKAAKDFISLTASHWNKS